MPKKVAIVIVNYNNYIDTIECLNSLKRLKYPFFEVFLVDNKSTNDSVEKISKYLKENQLEFPVHLLLSPLNNGFAGGNNYALNFILMDKNYDYIWLLNNDTEVEDNTLTNLVAVLDQDDRAGITGSKIYYYRSNKIWFAGGEVNFLTGKTNHIGINQFNSNVYEHRKSVDYITGCSLLIRREVIDEIGLLPEEYFLYYEEVEWNVLAKKKGWKIMYCPDSIVYHKISSSSGGVKSPSPSTLYYKMRNRIIFVKRNSKISYYFLFSMFLDIFKKIVKIFLQQNMKFSRCRFIIKAIKDGKNNVTGKITV